MKPDQISKDPVVSILPAADFSIGNAPSRLQALLERMGSFMRKSIALPVALSVAALATAGCGHLGATALKSARPHYNTAFASSTDQELLLNIVRLRYRDTPFFLTVDRVASSSSLDFNGNISPDLTRLKYFAPSLNGAAGESPTVFYSPMEGEKFARQMMSRMNFDVILLLANSGWSIERLFIVTLQEMNGLKNAPTASGPTPSKEPEFREFRTALRHLRALQLKGLVELARGDSGEESSLVLRIINGEKDEDAIKFKKLMGLDAGLNLFPLQAGMGRGDGKSIYVITRPVVSTLNYLSQSVVAPKSDVTAGRVTQTVKKSGEPFDWQELFEGIFKVQSSKLLAPVNASVSIHYRGAWFYIADNDLDSKSTFSLLTQILAVQSGKAAGKETPLSFSFGK